jgi:hypothetical protein
MFKPIRLGIAAAIGLLMLAAASQGAWYETAADIAAGHVWADDSRFDASGYMSIYRNGVPYIGGTANMITDRWLLTAGHILAASGDPFGYNISEIRFRTGIDPFGVGPEHLRYAESWVVHPLYLEGVGEGVDLALVRLSEPITDIVPISLYSGEPEIGMEFETAGYGRPGSVETGMLSTDWKKRAGRNLVSSFAFGTDGYIWSSFDQGANALPLEWNSTPGDSGAKWATLGNELFAVNSFGVGTTYTGAQMIYPHLDWIYGVTGLPEPGTLVLLLCGGLMFLRRRRRLC